MWREVCWNFWEKEVFFFFYKAYLKYISSSEWYGLNYSSHFSTWGWSVWGCSPGETEDGAKSMGDREERQRGSRSCVRPLKQWCQKLPRTILTLYFWFSELIKSLMLLPIWVGFLFIFIHKYLGDTVPFNVCVNKHGDSGVPCSRAGEELYLIHYLFLGTKDSLGVWVGTLLSVSPFSTQKRSACPPTISKSGFFAWAFQHVSRFLRSFYITSINSFFPATPPLEY